MEKEEYLKAINELQEIILAYLEKDKLPIAMAQQAVSGLSDYIYKQYTRLKKMQQ